MDDGSQIPYPFTECSWSRGRTCAGSFFHHPVAYHRTDSDDDQHVPAWPESSVRLLFSGRRRL
jgi:hypothetical protein